MKHHYVLRLFLFITVCISYVLSSSSKSYGQYDIMLAGIKSCKGPKRQDCANTTITFKGKSSLIYDILVFENISSIKAKVIGIFDDKEVVNIRLVKPCEHIFFMPLLKVFLKVSDECIILKGHYTFTIDMGNIMKDYHGEAFIFGNWTYKAIFYNDNCNFSCGIYRVTVIPKKKT